MTALPNFAEALRRQREVFAPEYQADPELAQYVAGLLGETDSEDQDHE